MSKAKPFAAAALADLTAALASAAPAPHEGPAFTGSSNCLPNIENDYARRRRGHWFDKSSMRFFQTRFLTGFYDVPSHGVTLFITTDKGAYAPRAATIRAYIWKSADVVTLGAFNAHSNAVAEKALDLLLADLKAA